MSTRRNGISKHQRAEKFCGEGPNWILIAGGALLSTLSIRFGYKLKQSLDLKPRSNGSAGLKTNGTSDRQKSTSCCLHSNTSSCAHNNDYCCFRSIPGSETVEGKEVANEQMVSASDTSLPLVTVPAPSFGKENGVMWATSPDRLELPPKPYNHHSTCSDSPCVSETSSDIFSKREVIQKLRQQLKRRDDMILEMQEQILELQKSDNAQMAHCSHLQKQLETMNKDLFESEREVQRLRKAIGDHSVGCCAGSNGNGKTSPVAPWSGHVNGFMESESNYESVEKRRDGERVEMLRKEVSELKEVIDGKEYLLRSYKEQKIELSEKIKELQQRLDSQLPNILTATSIFGGSGSLRIDSMADKRQLLVCRSCGGGGLDDMDEGQIEIIGVHDEDDDESIQGHSINSSTSSERWDVLGLGQAMVDFSGVVDDEFLNKLGLEKGTRKLINHEERGKVLQAMDGCSYKAAAGGSLSNTLVALARLGCQSTGDRPLNVAMAGSIGSDPLGSFYRTKLRRANVDFLSAPIKDGTTGTVIVLTTPDAQRTMLAYQGTSSVVNYDSCLASLISKTNVFVVEGYLFELPDTIRTITKACEEAHRNGALVAVTASDVSCIERHYDDFWDIVGNYADIVFANSDEARAFCHFSAEESPISATRYMSHFVPFVSVTDGINGSYIGVKGEAIYIPPSPCVPVDTCGAGDAYASGILYGILRGVSDLKGMGDLAATIAATVVGQQGTRLRVQDAVELARSQAFRLNSSGVRTDIGS